MNATAGPAPDSPPPPAQGAATAAGGSGPQDGANAQRDLVRWLSRPGAYTDGTRQVECVETHISWVFLTDRHACKLKKSVRFEFLDFSTVERRRAACEEEVRLNRRLARNVYLGVAPITRDAQGRLHLGGSGAPIDWVVKMRRLPADRSLDQLLLARRLTEADVDRVGQLLAQFYAQSSPLTTRAEEYRGAIERHLRGNRDDLARHEPWVDPRQLRRVHSAQLRFLRLRGELLDQRVCDGRIVDGHGDLRAEHVYLAPDPAVIDALEFSPELRRIDVADELCFLAMECDALRAEWVGERLLRRYCEATHDAPPAELQAFYKCYRACVRAKVAALRCDQQTPAAQRLSRQRVGVYLALADRYAQQLPAPPLIVMRGLMGSGKSTLARALAEALDAERYATDDLRRELIGGDGEDAYSAGRYEPAQRRRVYDALLRAADGTLDGGLGAVLDGSFLSAQSCREAMELAALRRAPWLLVECLCPRDVAMERIAERRVAGRDASQARPDLYDEQARAAEPPPAGAPVLTIDTRESLPEQVRQVLAALASASTQQPV